MIMEIDGQEIDMEGIDPNTIVIVRPTKTYDEKDMKRLSRSIDSVKKIFGKYGISLVLANFDEVTFEVIYPKKPKDQH